MKSGKKPMLSKAKKAIKADIKQDKMLVDKMKKETKGKLGKD